MPGARLNRESAQELEEAARVVKSRNSVLIVFMSALEQIEEQVKRLSKTEQEALREWLENIFEDELEFTDEFKAKIERGERDIREGRVRIRKP
jgi:hypothetical protein